METLIHFTFVGPDNERALGAALQPAVAVDQVSHVFRHGQRGGVHGQRLEGGGAELRFGAKRLHTSDLKELPVTRIRVTCLAPSMCTVSRAWPSLPAEQEMPRT